MLGPRRGIVVRGFPPSSTDQDALEFAFFKAVKGDMKCGVPEISRCDFTEDMQQAYVEFVNPDGECQCGVVLLVIVINVTHTTNQMVCTHNFSVLLYA